MSPRVLSVWSWSQGLYFYYAASGVAPAPAATPIRPPLGDPPELLLPELPPDAVYLGCGVEARGDLVSARMRGAP